MASDWGVAMFRFPLWPGEILGIGRESGSGKSTLLRCLAGIDERSSGHVRFDFRDQLVNLFELPEPERRRLMRTEWGIVHQNPRDGLRMDISAGGNIGERLMDRGDRHYGNIRDAALDWLGRVEISAGAHRRSSASIFGWHAAAPADRACSLRPARVWRLWTSRPEASMFPCKRVCLICYACWCVTSGKSPSSLSRMILPLPVF